MISDNNTNEIKVDDQDVKDSTFIPESIQNFDELDIPCDLLRGIFGYGFESPSPIQSTAILPIIAKRNLIAQAQSGTGKTGAFTVGCLALIDLKIKQTQVLILSPTRELAGQIAEVVIKIGAMMSGLHVKTIIGGTHIRDDALNLKNMVPHVIVGCPGRVHDMIGRKYINLVGLKLIILDEADEMLSIGFEDQVYNIFQCLPESAQVALFSATLPPNILRLSEKFMHDPVNISVAPEKLSLDGIKQNYVLVHDDQQKYDTIKDLYQNISMAQCIIYCNTVSRVTHLYEAMTNDSFPVCCIHGKQEKADRDKAFQAFKCGECRVLISSDITARGIDVQQVNMVINFDVPSNMQTYLHRIGRSGRWGRKGTAINLATKRDKFLLEDLEGYYCCQIGELTDELLNNKI